MEVSGQLHAPAVLSPKKQPSKKASGGGNGLDFVGRKSIKKTYWEAILQQ
jgi:hypothetical protein